MAGFRTIRLTMVFAIVLPAMSGVAGWTVGPRSVSAGGTAEAATVFSTQPDFYLAEYGFPVSGAAFANDTGDGLTFVSSDCRLDGEVFLFGPDGRFSSTPLSTRLPGFTWQCHYTVRDSTGAHLTESITVMIVAQGYALVADAYETLQNTPLTVDAPGVQANDKLGPPLTISLATTPTHGTVDLGASGDFTYSANPGFAGTDTFAYRGTNTDYGVSMTTTVTIQVLADPVAQNDAYQTVKNTPLTIAAPGVLGNDAAAGVVAVLLPERATSGSLTAVGLGGFTYDPDPGYEGTDSFQYSLRDGYGRISSATVTILVTGAVTPTATATRTPTATATATKTNTPTATATKTATPTASATKTPTIVLPTSTATKTATATATKTNSPTATKTPVPPTSTKTATATPTKTPTLVAPSATNTQVAPTATKTATVQPGVPAVSLSRTRTTVNTPVQFTISGFTPNQDVTIKWRRLTGSIFDILTVRTDGSGGATGSFRVPATPGGPGQEVRFVQGNITKTVPFEIRARIKITPDPAARGQEIDISLRGYSRTETVRIRWLLNGKFEQIATVQTSNTGSANLKIAVPSFIPDGEHSVRGDGSLFRQQTNVMTVLGGTPFTPQVVPAEATETNTPTPTSTVTPTATASPTPAPTEPAEPTVEATVIPTIEATVEPTAAATEIPISAPGATPEATLETSDETTPPPSSPAVPSPEASPTAEGTPGEA